MMVANAEQNVEGGILKNEKTIVRVYGFSFSRTCCMFEGFRQ